MNELTSILTSIMNVITGILGLATKEAGSSISGLFPAGKKKGKKKEGRISGHSMQSGLAREAIDDYSKLSAAGDYKKDLTKNYSTSSHSTSTGSAAGGSGVEGPGLSRGQKFIAKTDADRQKVASAGGVISLRRSGGSSMEKYQLKGRDAAKAKPYLTSREPRRATRSGESSVRKFIKT